MTGIFSSTTGRSHRQMTMVTNQPKLLTWLALEIPGKRWCKGESFSLYHSCAQSGSYWSSGLCCDLMLLYKEQSPSLGMLQQLTIRSPGSSRKMQCFRHLLWHCYRRKKDKSTCKSGVIFKLFGSVADSVYSWLWKPCDSCCNCAGLPLSHERSQG